MTGDLSMSEHPAAVSSLPGYGLQVDHSLEGP